MADQITPDQMNSAPTADHRTAFYKGVEYHFPNEMTDDQFMRQIGEKDPSKVVISPAPASVPGAFGESGGRPFQAIPPGPTGKPMPPGINVNPGRSTLDRLREAAGRISNTVQFGAAGLPGGPFVAGPLALGGAMLPPDTSPGTSMGATAANLAFNQFFPELGAMGRGARLVRGLIGAGVTGGGGLVGALVDHTMGGMPIKTQYGKIGFLTAGTAAANSLKAMVAPTANALSPTGQAAQNVQDLTGGSVPLSVPQQTGNSILEAMNRFTRGGAASRDLALRQTKAAIDVVGRIAGRDPSEVFDVAKQATPEVQGAAQRFWGSLLDQFNASKIDEAAAEGPGKIIDPSSGNPFLNAEQAGKTVADTDALKWKLIGAEHGLSEADISNLRTAINKAPKEFLDQFLSSEGEASPNAQLAASLMKALPEQEKGTFGTALVLRWLDKSKAAIYDADGPLLNGSSFNQAIRANGALKQVLTNEQYTALTELGKVMEGVKPSVSGSLPGGAPERILNYLASKYTFTLAGVVAGGVLGHNQNASQQLLGSLVGGALGGTVTLGLSTVLGRILTHPETMQLLIDAAKGDASAASAFVRGVVTGVDPSKPQADDQRQPVRTGAAPPLANFMRGQRSNRGPIPVAR